MQCASNFSRRQQTVSCQMTYLLGLNRWIKQQYGLQMSSKMFLYSVKHTTLRYCLVGYEKFSNSLENLTPW